MPDPVAVAPCPALRVVVVVGGSFMEQVSRRMAMSGCRPTIVQYQYWQIIRFSWVDGVESFSPVDKADRARTLMDANVLLYEENEQNIARTKHGPASYDFLSQQPGWVAAATPGKGA